MTDIIKTYLDTPSIVNLKLPEGATDTHVHIFGPSEKFPYAESRGFTPADAPKESLFALHKKLGIDRCVIVNTLFTALTIAWSRMRCARLKVVI